MSTIILPRTMRRFDRISSRMERIVRLVCPRPGENLAQAVERALEEMYRRGYADGLNAVQEYSFFTYWVSGAALTQKEEKP